MVLSPERSIFQTLGRICVSLGAGWRTRGGQRQNPKSAKVPRRMNCTGVAGIPPEVRERITNMAGTFPRAATRFALSPGAIVANARTLVRIPRRGRHTLGNAYTPPFPLSLCSTATEVRVIPRVSLKVNRFPDNLQLRQL